MEIQTERSLSITHLADHQAECVKTVHLLEKKCKDLWKNLGYDYISSYTALACRLIPFHTHTHKQLMASRFSAWTMTPSIQKLTSTNSTLKWGRARHRWLLRKHTHNCVCLYQDPTQLIVLYCINAKDRKKTNKDKEKVWVPPGRICEGNCCVVKETLTQILLYITQHFNTMTFFSATAWLKHLEVSHCWLIETHY